MTKKSENQKDHSRSKRWTRVNECSGWRLLMPSACFALLKWGNYSLVCIIIMLCYEINVYICNCWQCSMNKLKSIQKKSWLAVDWAVDGVVHIIISLGARPFLRGDSAVSHNHRNTQYCMCFARMVDIWGAPAAVAKDLVRPDFVRGDQIFRNIWSPGQNNNYSMISYMKYREIFSRIEVSTKYIARFMQHLQDSPLKINS